jgi:hypothetical protein
MNADFSLQWCCNYSGSVELVFVNVIFKRPRCSAVAVANWLGTCHTGASGIPQLLHVTDRFFGRNRIRAMDCRVTTFDS